MIPGVVAWRRSGSYTGPLDLVPGAIWAVSLRAMTADSGAEAVRIQRGGDNAQQTFSCTTNNAVGVAAVASFIAAGDGNGYIKTLFDQVGNIDPTIADPTGASAWVGNMQGSKPGMTLSSAAPLVSVGNISIAGGQATIFVVVKGDANVLLSTSGAYADFWFGATAYVDLFDETNEAGGSYSGLASGDQFYLYVVTVEFDNNSFTYNGTTAPENNANDAGGPLGAITRPVTIYADSGIQEVILYDSILSVANIALLEANIAAYYGITLS